MIVGKEKTSYTAKEGQLCLSNEDLCEEYKDEIDKLDASIKADPYSLSFKQREALETLMDNNCGI